MFLPSTNDALLTMLSLASSYSSMYWEAQLTSSLPFLRFPPFRISFRLCHMAHAILTVFATTSSSARSPTSISHSRSWKDCTLARLDGTTIFKQDYTSLAFVHVQNRRPVVSASNRHSSQISSCTTFHCMRLTFMGRISLHAPHVEWWTLCGRGNSHIFFQNKCNWLLFEPAPRSTNLESRIAIP